MIVHVPTDELEALIGDGFTDFLVRNAIGRPASGAGVPGHIASYLTDRGFELVRVEAAEVAA